MLCLRVAVWPQHVLRCHEDVTPLFCGHYCGTAVAALLFDIKRVVSIASWGETKDELSKGTIARRFPCHRRGMWFFLILYCQSGALYICTRYVYTKYVCSMCVCFLVAIPMCIGVMCYVLQRMILFCFGAFLLVLEHTAGALGFGRKRGGSRSPGTAPRSKPCHPP